MSVANQDSPTLRMAIQKAFEHLIRGPATFVKTERVDAVLADGTLIVGGASLRTSGVTRGIQAGSQVQVLYSQKPGMRVLERRLVLQHQARRGLMPSPPLALGGIVEELFIAAGFDGQLDIWYRSASQVTPLGIRGVVSDEPLGVAWGVDHVYFVVWTINRVYHVFRLNRDAHHVLTDTARATFVRMERPFNTTDSLIEINGSFHNETTQWYVMATSHAAPPSMEYALITDANDWTGAHDGTITLRDVFHPIPSADVTVTLNTDSTISIAFDHTATIGASTKHFTWTVMAIIRDTWVTATGTLRFNLVFHVAVTLQEIRTDVGVRIYFLPLSDDGFPQVSGTEIVIIPFGDAGTVDVSDAGLCGTWGPEIGWLWRNFKTLYSMEAHAIETFFGAGLAFGPGTADVDPGVIVHFPDSGVYTYASFIDPSIPFDVDLTVPQPTDSGVFSTGTDPLNSLLLPSMNAFLDQAAHAAGASGFFGTEDRIFPTAEIDHRFSLSSAGVGRFDEPSQSRHALAHNAFVVDEFRLVHFDDDPTKQRFFITGRATPGTTTATWRAGSVAYVIDGTGHLITILRNLTLTTDPNPEADLSMPPIVRFLSGSATHTLWSQIFYGTNPATSEPEVQAEIVLTNLATGMSVVVASGADQLATFANAEIEISDAVGAGTAQPPAAKVYAWADALRELVMAWEADGTPTLHVASHSFPIQDTSIDPTQTGLMDVNRATALVSHHQDALSLGFVSSCVVIAVTPRGREHASLVSIDPFFPTMLTWRNPPSTRSVLIYWLTDTSPGLWIWSVAELAAVESCDLRTTAFVLSDRGPGLPTRGLVYEA